MIVAVFVFIVSITGLSIAGISFLRNVSASSSLSETPATSSPSETPPDRSTNVQASETSGNTLTDGEIVDGSEETTIRNGIHSCPEGWFIVGVKPAGSDQNNYLCSNRYGTYDGTQEIVVRPEQRQGTGACPIGYALTGFNGARTQMTISCARTTNTGEEFIHEADAEAARNDIPACPAGSVMVGIGPARFLCKP